MYTDPSGYDIAPYRDRHNRDEIEPLETLYLDRFGFDSDGNWWCTDGFGNSNGHIYDWTSFDNWIDEVRLERANRPDGPGEGENCNGAHGNYYDWKTGTYRSTFSRREVSWQYAIGVSLAADLAETILYGNRNNFGPMLACLGGGSDSGGNGVTIGSSFDITVATPFGCLTPLLGFTVEGGNVGNPQGSGKNFISFGNAVGIEVSFGFNVFLLIPVNEGYSINDFEGMSYAYSGNWEFLSISLSGNSHHGSLEDTFGDSYIVVKVGIGLGFGGSTSRTQTEFLKERPKNFTFMPVIKY